MIGNGPIFIYTDPEDDQPVVVGEMDFATTPALPARTIVFLDSAEDAEAVRQALLDGKPIPVKLDTADPVADRPQGSERPEAWYIRPSCDEE